ncbi:MAG TPA: DUF72 domain-containing protein [Thermoanaerobaculia bacterium]|nr:DUF72 domain-containing protein [Thermoanaerobaculia bacterium]
MAADASRTRGSFRVGCSGWQYRHWRGNLYPAELPASRWFDHYAERFDTVEINNSFYRLPEASVFGAWRRRAPPGFLYAVKASRYLTHNKKLKDPEEPIERFFDRAKQLREKLGPVLYQLPPGWKVNLERLETFLSLVPRRVRHVMEFRDPSWYSDEVLGALDRRGVALCLHDMPGSAPERATVGSFVYVRFHGFGQRYGGRYSDDRLEDWAEWLTARTGEGKDVYAYFNNDVGGHAPRDALRLRAMLERLAVGAGGRAQGSGTARRPRRASRSRIDCWASTAASPAPGLRRT